LVRLGGPSENAANRVADVSAVGKRRPGRFERRGVRQAVLREAVT
jgi:hypothetical protein